MVTSLDQIPGDAAIDAIVNLAGEPIADALWTLAKRRRIITSRLRMTPWKFTTFGLSTALAGAAVELGWAVAVVA